MDSHSAAILARLYAAHGQLADARRVLRRARIYRPEQRVLWELAVKVAENLEEEEAAYEELTRRFPDEPKYAIALGTTLVNRGKYTQARKVLLPISKKGPAANCGQAHYQLARSYLQEDQAAQALEHVVAAGKADPESIRSLPALLFKALVYEKLGRTSDALHAYRDALRVESESPEILGKLVRICLDTNDRDAALDYLRRYTVSVGSDVEGLVTAAEFHLRLGRYEDAFDLASRAREERFDARAQAVLGLVYLCQGDFAKAAFHLERGEPNAPVVSGLMRCYVQLGKLRAAEEQLQRADKLTKRTDDLASMAAVVRELLGRRETLLSRAGVSGDQRDIWRNALGHYVCAEHAWEAGRPPEQVEALLKPVAQEGVDYGPAHALRGVLALECGQLSKALSEAEQALQCDARCANCYYVRGRVRLERGVEGALADLRQAAELSERKNAAVLHWLARALVQAGRLHDALATQREAVKLKPGDARMAEQLREFDALTAQQ
jgi:tetratricopeptide (TPR) repeat protein